MDGSNERSEATAWSKRLATASALTAILAGVLVTGALRGALAVVGVVAVLALLGFMGYAGRRLANDGWPRGG
jgi:hypothetical protein